MRAITFARPGGSDVLEMTEQPTPHPGPGQVLIKVAAAGINRADVLQRMGKYPPPPGASDILGLECSGVIAAIGPNEAGKAPINWQVGDEVCALLAGGGYAEYVVVPATQLLPLPTGIDLITSAALPEVACTVWSNVVGFAQLKPGETLLIHGGASGIGTHAIQVGKALGARVAVTVGSADRARRCLELGADIAVNYRDQDFVAQVGQADVVLDIMGADYFAKNLEILAPDGRLLIIATQSGRKTEIDLGQIFARRAVITSSSLRSRPLDGPAGKADIISSVHNGLWPLVASGQVKPVIHQILPFARAGQAHALLEQSGTVFGKLVLAW